MPGAAAARARAGWDLWGADMPDRPPETGRRFWLLTGDVPEGPHDLAGVHERLASGAATWQTLACPVGGGDWVPLARLPGIAPPPVDPAATGEVPQAVAAPAPHIVPAGPAAPPRRAWNPVAIAWLGVAFTPLWAGVMAAVNGRRLASPVPAWWPLAVAAGYLVTDIVFAASITSPLLDVALYLGAVALLWPVALRHQAGPYAAVRAAGGADAGWAVPALAGAPLAALAFLAFVVEPLRPLEPREVCERFAAARSAKDAAQYVTANLAPALRLFDADDADDGGDLLRFELTDEAAAPADVGGGHLVGCRVSFAEGGGVRLLEGVFHLVDWGGAWKVEDVYFTAVNRQPLEPYLSLARDYERLVPPPAKAAAKGGPARR